MYSTYLGGSGFDEPASIAVDTLGEAYVAGTTTSQDFPWSMLTSPLPLPTRAALYGNYGFVTKFTAHGSSLNYSTYFAGNLTVVPNCGSPCWPTPYTHISAVAAGCRRQCLRCWNDQYFEFPGHTSGAYQTRNSPAADATIAFVSKFASRGYPRLFHLLLWHQRKPGRNWSDRRRCIRLGLYRRNRLERRHFSHHFDQHLQPSVYGFGCSYSFVSKFDPTASTLLYSTFLGPNNYASPQSIAVDASNNAYVLATTDSATFGTNNAIEGYTSGWDMLLVEIDPSATTELFATYLGASGNEFASGMARDVNGNIYVAGSTDSTDFPVTQGAFQNLLGGNTDAFVMKIGTNSAPAVSLSPGALQYASLQLALPARPRRCCCATWAVRGCRFHRSRPAETSPKATVAEPA